MRWLVIDDAVSHSELYATLECVEGCSGLLPMRRSCRTVSAHTWRGCDERQIVVLHQPHLVIGKDAASQSCQQYAALRTHRESEDTTTVQAVYQFSGNGVGQNRIECERTMSGLVDWSR